MGTQIKISDIRDRVITGSYSISPEGMKEDASGWEHYARRLEQMVSMGNFQPLDSTEEPEKEQIFEGFTFLPTKDEVEIAKNNYKDRNERMAFLEGYLFLLDHLKNHVESHPLPESRSEQTDGMFMITEDGPQMIEGEQTSQNTIVYSESADNDKWEKSKEELGENIYHIFKNVERIHGKSESIDWLKLASYRAAGWFASHNKKVTETKNLIGFKKQLEVIMRCGIDLGLNDWAIIDYCKTFLNSLRDHNK